MWEFVLRRLLAAIPVIFGVVVFIFFITHIVPANPAKLYAGIKASTATLEQIRQRLHLNDPLPVQFYYYLVNLLSGNLGYSLSIRTSVNTGIAEFYPITFGVVILSIAWSAPLGIFLGIVSATRMNKLSDIAARTIAYAGLSFPSFFFAIILQIVFAVDLKVLPLTGLLSPSDTLPRHITGFYLFDSILTANIPDFISSIDHLIMPVLALGFLSMASVMRMTRSSMLEVLSAPFVKALRAKGVPEGSIVRRYAFRAAMGPTLTILALTIGGLLGGSVFIEEIFGLGGFSEWTYQAILGFDYNVVVAYTLFISIAYVGSSIIVDIAYAWIEPKIRFADRG